MEEAVTQYSPDPFGPAQADNPPGSPVSPGAEGSHDGTPPPDSAAGESPPIWQQHGFSSADDLSRAFADLRQRDERHRQQLTGSHTEVQRLQQELARMQGQVQQAQSWQSQVAHMLGGQGQSQAPSVLSQAFEAYLNGNQDALRQAEQQLVSGRGYSPQELDTYLMDRLTTMTRPAQFAEMIGRKHPELQQSDTEVYKRVYDLYDQYAQDSSVRLKYPDDPTAMMDVPSPDGYSKKRVDLRLIDDLAWQIKYQVSREQGRQEEAARSGAPTVQGQARGRGQSAGSDPWGLLSREEQAEIQNLIRTGASKAAGWGEDPKAIAKRLWEGMSKAEQQKRIGG